MGRKIGTRHGMMGERGDFSGIRGNIKTACRTLRKKMLYFMQNMVDNAPACYYNAYKDVRRLMSYALSRQ